MKNKLLDMTFRLTLICAAAAFILGIVNIVTEPVIIERKRIEKEKALKALSDGDHVGEIQLPANSDDLHNQLMASLMEHGVIGSGDELDEKELITSIYPVDKNGEITKYILQLEGSGYGGKMILLAVFSLDGSFVKAKLMENNETPGLGKKAEDSLYYNMFEKKGTSEDPVPVSKRALSDSAAEAISGSTITFNGISKALALGSDYVKLLGGKN
ncbi:MAG: FMN-binding protein [Spirochaetaceae bacterium]|nr:FMN-binding protein [Spirochaetaceae bacterium]